METMHTETNFDQLSWHDCPIWGLQFHVGDPDANDWTRDLVLDIDFILEWICGVGEGVQFRIAPATLVFHGVTDLKIHIDWETSGFQLSLHEVTIGHIERKRLEKQKVHLDRPYYSWQITLNWPQGGEITFGAVGFTQALQIGRAHV